MARHEHTPFYSVDWKYQASERALPDWPEVHEDMQDRLDRTLNHILRAYSAAASELDLSIIFVTHASPVNGKTTIPMLLLGALADRLCNHLSLK